MTSLSTALAGSERRRSPQRATANLSIPIGGLDPWQVESIEKIAAFGALAPGWDSYGSPPVSEETIEAALSLVQLIQVDGLPIPRVLPVSGGGIHFEWELGNRDLEVELSADGSLDALACINGDPIEVATRSIHGLLRWLVSG